MREGDERKGGKGWALYIYTYAKLIDGKLSILNLVIIEMTVKTHYYSSYIMINL